MDDDEAPPAQRRFSAVRRMSRDSTLAGKPIRTGEGDAPPPAQRRLSAIRRASRESLKIGKHDSIRSGRRIAGFSDNVSYRVCGRQRSNVA